MMPRDLSEITASLSSCAVPSTALRSLRFSMQRKLALRFLGIFLVVAVFVLGVQVVAHFDGFSHDEDHCTCQICHIAHAAVPQPAAQAEVKVRLATARLAVREALAPTTEVSNILSIPRAPPA